MLQSRQNMQEIDNFSELKKHFSYELCVNKVLDDKHTCREACEDVLDNFPMKTD